jgi:hypothetical protein
LLQETLPIGCIQQWIFEQGIVADREKAIEVIHSLVGYDFMTEGEINMKDFDKLF